MLHDNMLFIGTEEKMLYMLDRVSFEIIDRIQTQSYIFTMCPVSDDTIFCGQYQGYVDVIQIKSHQTLVKLRQEKLLTGNIYKIIKTDRAREYAFGCGNGLYFAEYDKNQFYVSDDKVFAGKYVTQVLNVSKETYLVSIWN